VFVGRSTLDIVYGCARFPEPDGKVDAEVAYVAGGGPALNAAIAFAALGGRARLCSVVGQGVFADRARTDLNAHGVELEDAAAGEADVLPVSSVILTGPSRAIVNQPLPAGAAAPEHDGSGRNRAVAGSCSGILDSGRVASGKPASTFPQPALSPERLERLFEPRPDVVLSDGHLPALALPVLRRARRAGVRTVLDGGSWKPWTAELLPWIDIAIVSSRFAPPDAADVLDFLRTRVGAVAVTSGPEPVRWSAGEASGEVRPPAAEAVDTLGAGDIFHGAFCHAFAEGGGDFSASLASAAGIASRSCAFWGPRAWIAGRAGRG
jgi:sugar/nucleoside kinase (ribokinase family)